MRIVAALLFVAPFAAVTASQAHANPGVMVFPGMEIHQATHVCTLGYVDPGLRVAFTAGHCRGDGPVTDRDGNLIGTMALFRDNTPDGATVTTDHMITDYEAINLLDSVVLNNVLPGGRALESVPGVEATDGQAVCHFGVITAESCGTVESVNNGWFTMSNGIVSQKGDSGGPVYLLADNGRAIMVGLFNSTWGQFPAATSWEATAQQVREDLGTVSAAGLTTIAPPA